MPNYDSVAPYYDFISGLVFGQQLTKAESYYFSQLKEPASILYFGGGTGKGLELLLPLFPKAKIYFLEASSKMISIASKRKIPGMESIEFIHGTEQQLSTFNRQCDLIITPFVLDVFPENQLDGVLDTLYRTLAPGGHWIQTDFYVDQKSPWWQKALVSIMYLFFKLTADQQVQRLADFDAYFDRKALRSRDQKEFCYGMVKTVLYRKD